jgi:hypothetical protein
MNDIFREELDQSVIIYLDDILIYSPNKEQHIKDVERVLEKLRQEHLYAKRTKCEFFKDEIAFLGHLICTGSQVPIVSGLNCYASRFC